MDLQIMKKGLNFSRRRKKWILLLAAFGVTGYTAYKVYNLPSVVKKRKRLIKLIGALISVIEVVADSSEMIGVVSKDLKVFLQSDSDEIPNSLKQISKIAKSNEFSESLIRVSQALTVGILKGYKLGMKSDNDSQTSYGFSDRIMDKLFSTAGSGFVSVVVGSFARNLVMAFYESFDGVNGEEQGKKSNLDSSSPEIPRWVDVICSGKCRELVAESIQVFVSTAVAVYLDKTMSINLYDELFTGLTNPKHETKVKNILVSLCNGAVETLIKTSHQVITSPNSISNSSGNLLKSSPIFRRSEDFGMDEDETFDREVIMKGYRSKSSSMYVEDSGWLSKVSSTLAIPSNRDLILDVTGRVTFETVRSFLDFILWKVQDGARRSFDVVQLEIIERGLDVMRYITAKSSVIFTVCLAVCLHLMDGARVLLPA